MKPVCLGSAMIAALLALVGCTLTRGDRRKGDGAGPMVIGGGGAGSLASKQAVVVIRIASRPVDDEALGSAIWDAADEQVIPGELRRALEAEGLRVGVLSGELPKELVAVLNSPPPKRVDPMTVVLPDGESTVVDLVSAPSKSLVLGRSKGEGSEKKYEDLHGFYRISARLGELGAVGLRIVPELHHGPIRRNWTPAPTIGSMAPVQFAIRDGQQEETMVDLRAEISLRPGQFAVVSGRPEKRGGLGEFLFSGVEPNSDRETRRVLILSATRADTDPAPGVLPAPPRLEPVEPPDMPPRDANPKGR